MPTLCRRTAEPFLSTLSHPSSLATLASLHIPPQHKGEPENHSQALEASPSRAREPEPEPRPHHPPAPSTGCCASGSGRGVSAPNGSGRPEPAHRAPGAEHLTPSCARTSPRRCVCSLANQHRGPPQPALPRSIAASVPLALGPRPIKAIMPRASCLLPRFWLAS